MKSVKSWLYLFSTDDLHRIVVNGTHSQVGPATAVIRSSPRSYAKQPSSAKVSIILIHLLTCIDASVANSLTRRQPDFDTQINKVNDFLSICDRKYNIILTRIRHNCSSLKADLHRVNIVPNPICDCGIDIENAGHYFFSALNIMINAIIYFRH